ncbi:tetratricopeptide repeat protein [Chryseobacterium sp. Bi04]|uniref:tetratricopeptide repeat protein n=1 Tax=Chryseobacterium sp. Bi04 TaxID=2822345 RepID=UPI001D4A876A|nr:tetratricopeptide repeat protein [Chryseobacterium sp. Bi04]CAH0248718.1 hypothetical protein SRABI04_03173 [Chryseobacterium sp. Bi04]
MMTRIFLSILLIILVSCSPDSKVYEKEFDTPLMIRNEEFRIAGDYDSLMTLNTKYYKKADSMGYQEGKALCYINLAQVNISLENYKKAEVFFDKAEIILRNSKNNTHKAIFYANYSRLNREFKNFDKAFEYNNEAMNYIRKSENPELKNRILFNIYFAQGEYYMIGQKYNLALESFHNMKKLDQTGIADCIISDYFYMRKNKDSAYKYISSAYNKMITGKKNDANALNIYTIMGEYYLTYKQYDKAEIEFKQALEIDKKTRRIFANYTKYIYNDLRMLYEQKGDQEKAFFYLNVYTKARNKTYDTLSATIDQDMQAFIEETIKDSEKQEKKVRWIILLMLAGFSLLGIYAWRIISLLRKKKAALTMETEKLKARVDGSKQDEILELARKNDPEFFNRFKETYPEFINRLLSINPNLETSELTFCAMIKLHFTSKEIAAYTLIQHRTVQQKKYRIRKRLHIPTETDIYHFFDELG